MGNMFFTAHAAMHIARASTGRPGAVIHACMRLLTTDTQDASSVTLIASSPTSLEYFWLQWRSLLASWSSQPRSLRLHYFGVLLPKLHTPLRVSNAASCRLQSTMTMSRFQPRLALLVLTNFKLFLPPLHVRPYLRYYHSVQPSGGHSSPLLSQAQHWTSS